LNPYEQGGYIMEFEAQNFVVDASRRKRLEPLYCEAISAKRFIPAGRQSSAMSLTGGGARQKRLRRPHERGLSVPKEPALLRDLEANQTAVHGSRRDRLDRLPLPWSAGRRTEGRAQRHVSARAQHEGGREGAPLAFGPPPAISEGDCRLSM